MFDVLRILLRPGNAKVAQLFSFIQIRADEYLDVLSSLRQIFGTLATLGGMT